MESSTLSFKFTGVRLIRLSVCFDDSWSQWDCLQGQPGTAGWVSIIAMVLTALTWVETRDNNFVSRCAVLLSSFCHNLCLTLIFRPATTVRKHHRRSHAKDHLPKQISAHSTLETHESTLPVSDPGQGSLLLWVCELLALFLAYKQTSLTMRWRIDYWTVRGTPYRALTGKKTSI